MNEYDIAIRETLEMTVTVEAENREEARRMVEERWKNGEYILDVIRAFMPSGPFFHIYLLGMIRKYHHPGIPALRTDMAVWKGNW